MPTTTHSHPSSCPTPQGLCSACFVYFLTWDDAHSPAMLIYTDWSMLSTCSVLLASKASCWGAPQITPSQETISNSLYVSLSFPAGSFPTATIEKPLSFTGNIYFKKKKVFSSPLPHILKEFAIGQTASSFSSPVRQTTNSQGQWESNAVSPDESEHCISNSV